MRPRALVINSGCDTTLPWWWQSLQQDQLDCQLEHQKVLLKRRRVTSPFSVDFVRLAFGILSILRRAKAQYATVFTFECGWESFIVALFQTIARSRRPRHVILQFIMRERTDRLRSRIKYAFMRWCLSSVHLCVCSSRSECSYYAEVFGWSGDKLRFVALNTDPRLLSLPNVACESFLLAAGRTFRDYPTLLDAFRDQTVPLRVVASRGDIDEDRLPPNVTVQYDIPSQELDSLMCRCLAVIVPLEERMISTGQSVIVNAMTVGKPVIATRTTGTVDYLDNMRTGILVPPRDPDAIREAVNLVVGNPNLRQSIGRAARQRILEAHLPHHYATAVARQLRARGS